MATTGMIIRFEMISSLLVLLLLVKLTQYRWEMRSPNIRNLWRTTDDKSVKLIGDAIMEGITYTVEASRE